MKSLSDTIYIVCLIGFVICITALFAMPVTKTHQQIIQEDDWLCSQSEKCMYERECRANGGIPHWKLFDKGCDM